MLSQCYQQFFWYWYFAGIRFAGFSVLRSVSFPPFLYTPPLSNPPFFQKGVGAPQKGGHCPPFEEKGGHCPLFDTEMYRPSFPFGMVGNTGEIPTEYRPKIPNWYTTLFLMSKNFLFVDACASTATKKTTISDRQCTYIK
jgi:hypothetical protein